MNSVEVMLGGKLDAVILFRKVPVGSPLETDLDILPDLSRMFKSCGKNLVAKCIARKKRFPVRPRHSNFELWNLGRGGCVRDDDQQNCPTPGNRPRKRMQIDIDHTTGLVAPNIMNNPPARLIDSLGG